MRSVQGEKAWKSLKWMLKKKWLCTLLIWCSLQAWTVTLTTTEYSMNICQSPSSPRQWKTKLLQFNIEVDFCSLCKLRSVVKMQMLQAKGQNGISRERSKNRHLKTALLILKFKKKKLMGGVFRTLNINKWSMLWCISAVSWGSCATSSKQCSYKYSTEVHQRKPDIAVKPHS